MLQANRYDLPAPTTGRPADVADWIEALMLIEGSDSMSQGVIRDRVVSSGISDDPGTLIEMVLSTVERRGRVAPHSYPFERDIVGIRHRDGVDPAIYEFLLWLTISPAFRALKDYADADYWFDQVVRASIESWLGPPAESVRFAFPSREGRPGNFGEAITWLAAKMKIAVRTPPDPDVKDGGADVIAWKGFSDERSGSLIVLCQATLQRDLRKKARDITPDTWRRWLAIDKDPITILAVPYELGIPAEKWEELGSIVNVVMDRFRVCEYPAWSLSERDLDMIRRWSATERYRLTPLSSEPEVA